MPPSNACLSLRFTVYNDRRADFREICASCDCNDPEAIKKKLKLLTEAVESKRQGTLSPPSLLSPSLSLSCSLSFFRFSFSLSLSLSRAINKKLKLMTEAIASEMHSRHFPKAGPVVEVERDCRTDFWERSTIERWGAGVEYHFQEIS